MKLAGDHGVTPLLLELEACFLDRLITLTTFDNIREVPDSFFIATRMIAARSSKTTPVPFLTIQRRHLL